MFSNPSIDEEVQKIGNAVDSLMRMFVDDYSNFEIIKVKDAANKEKDVLVLKKMMDVAIKRSNRV